MTMLGQREKSQGVSSTFRIYRKRPAHKKVYFLTPERVEAGRINLVRYLRRMYPLEYRAFIKVRVESLPYVEYTRKALGVRMGKGKGAVQGKQIPLYDPFQISIYKVSIPSFHNIERMSHFCASRRRKKLGVFCVSKY